MKNDSDNAGAVKCKILKTNILLILYRYNNTLTGIKYQFSNLLWRQLIVLGTSLTFQGVPQGFTHYDIS